MTHLRRHPVHLVGWALLGWVVAGAAAVAADWKPERNVEIIVAVSPGGGQDKTARLVQRLLSERRLAEVQPPDA